eukprot:1102047-Prymnesium_polylepis.1
MGCAGLVGANPPTAPARIVRKPTPDGPGAGDATRFEFALLVPGRGTRQPDTLTHTQEHGRAAAAPPGPKSKPDALAPLIVNWAGGG